MCVAQHTRIGQNSLNPVKAAYSACLFRASAVLCVSRHLYVVATVRHTSLPAHVHDFVDDQTRSLSSSIHEMMKVPRVTSGLSIALSTGLILVGRATAHEHHHTGPADDTVPVDGILWMHMGVQMFAWLFLFPLAMIMGLTRHRLHVPVAITALALTSSGYVLGHSHKGRSFPRGAHGSVASLLVPLLVLQGGLGTYLKLHLKWRGEGKVRPVILFIHSQVGKLFVVLGWLQMVLGVITLRSWCRGGATGQCLAHHIMGSAFIGYGIILLIMLKIGVDWLKRRNMSQEMLDSTVIFLWGCVNALTEHQGGPWTHKDLQHTLMGVVWVFGGAAGMWISRKGKRSVVPAVVIAITGWAMSGHAQALMISTMIHALFGYTLIAAGVTRIIEVCFLLEDHPTGHGADVTDASATRTAPTSGGHWYPIRAFQYLPIWLLFASGALFMSATDEELRWADNQGVDAVTWGLIDFSLAFFLFFWANVLIDFYVGQGGRFGSRKRNEQAAAAPSLMESATSLYARLSMGDSNSNSNEDRTAIGSGGSADSLEMDRIKSQRRAQQAEKDDEPRHVLFNGEEEEDEDPFDDDRINARGLRS